MHRLNNSVMKKFSVGYLFLFFASATAFAQQPSDLPPNSAPFNLSGAQVATFDHRYEGVKGFYTFLEDFVPGKVELKKDQVYDNVLINYDAVSDNLIAKSEKIGGLVTVRKDLIQRFVLKAEDVEYTFEKKTVKGIHVFLLKLTEGNTQFYCKLSKSIKQTDLGGPYNTSGANYDEFKQVVTYYFVGMEGSLSELPSNKKGILKAFPQLEIELTQFFKETKIDFNDFRQAQLLFFFIAQKSP